MWEHCTIHESFRDALIEGGMLLGDSGYPQQQWLMTPFSSPSTASERRYNVSQKRIRSTMERCIGILKSRFRCIDQTNGMLLFSPERSAVVIRAVTNLHNFARKRRMPVPTDDEILQRIMSAETNHPSGPYPAPFRTGVEAIRNRLVSQYFSR